MNFPGAIAVNTCRKDPPHHWLPTSGEHPQNRFFSLSAAEGPEDRDSCVNLVSLAAAFHGVRVVFVRSVLAANVMVPTVFQDPDEETRSTGSGDCAWNDLDGTGS